MRKRSGGFSVFVAAVVVWAGACGHEPFEPGRACAADTTRACYSGPDGTEGVGACTAGMETCKSDESGWGPCLGEIGPQPETCIVAPGAPDKTPVDEDCDGKTNEEGEGCACGPGSFEACYTGPMGTEGVGICSAGGRSCTSAGLWGACVNQVLPKTEDCASPLDEDCDGFACAAPRWGALFGTADAQTPAAIATDAEGNALLVGTFAGAIDFGGGALLSGGGTDAFVAKLDDHGNELWSVRVGDVGAELAASVAVDDAGDVVLVGSFDSITLDLGGDSVANGGGRDVFVAKLDGVTGEPLWLHPLGLSGDQEPTSVAIDVNGNVLVGGWFTGQLGCFGSPPVCIGSSGGTDGFLARFDPDGSFLSAVRVGGPANDRVNGLAFDPAGNAVVVGTFAISAKWGGVTLSTTGGADQDMFVARLDPNGATVWAKDFGDVGSQQATAVAIDAQGNATVTGHTTGLVSFGGNVGDLGGVGARAFAVQLSAAGTPLWARDFGTAGGSATLVSVAVDASANVALTGSFGGTVDFGAGALTAKGPTDAFLLKLGASGATSWSKRFGEGTFDEGGQGVAFTPAGDVLFAATIGGSVDFGSGVLTSAGASDVGAAAFAP